MLPDNIRVNFTIKPKVLLASPLVILPAFAIWCIPWSSSLAPSWVQGVGSVLAIIVAIVLGEKQTHQRRVEAGLERVERAKMMLAIADTVVPRLVQACEMNALTPSVVVKRVARAAREDALLLRQVDFTQAPNSNIACLWVGMIGCANAVDEELAKMSGQIPVDGLEAHSLKATKHSLEMFHRQLLTEVRRLEEGQM